MATALAAVGALVMSGGLVMLGAGTASADDPPCVPVAAYTETTGWVTSSPGPGWYQIDQRTTPGTDPVPEIKEFRYRHLVKEAVPDTIRNDDTWYSYNPAVDADGNVTTGYPVGDDSADKANGWQINHGNHTGQYEDPNFAVGVPWQEGSGNGSWFFVAREVITIPGSPAEYEYVWARQSPGGGWEPTGEERVVQVYVPGTSALTEYRYAFDHAAVPCPAPTDVCTNLDGVQATVPAGYELVNGLCVQIAGVEEVAPEITFTDPDCDNLDGADWSGNLKEIIAYEVTGTPGLGESITVTASIKPALADQYAFPKGFDATVDHTYPTLAELECVLGEETVVPSPKPEQNPPVVLGTEAAVPTQVNAGMASLPGAGTTTSALLAQLLVGTGLILLVAGGWVGFAGRDYGKHHI